jgi:RNA polymerase sigma factor (sigma-70 family)
VSTGSRWASEHLLREWAPQVLGAVMRRFGHFADAEDAVQEALLAAARQWPAEGVPNNPRGWLIQVASRRLMDQLRSELARRQRETESIQQGLMAAAESLPPDQMDDVIEDDALTLFFMCCHPALTPASAIALTLRAVGGLTTAEIARAFLVPEASMAQRISRAKQRIRESGVPFRLPDEREQAQRLDSVLHVLYLIFNEGYASSIGPHLQRSDLANEAIRLTRMVHARLPESSEVSGLLALMLLTDARRAARSDADGNLIPMAEQNRALWDRVLIVEGVALISAAFPRGAIGPYQLQAAIAAVHDEAVSHEATDWPQILALYTLLKRMADNPAVALNHAIAAAMVHGPHLGLELLSALRGDERLSHSHRLDAAQAHLLEMAGDTAAARAHYAAAARRTTSLPERNYLSARAARLAVTAT